MRLSSRWSQGSTETFETLYRSLAAGALLAGTDDPRFATAWALASADRFGPAPVLAASAAPAELDLAA